jgi:CspA family cold shock protein
VSADELGYETEWIPEHSDRQMNDGRTTTVNDRRTTTVNDRRTTTVTRTGTTMTGQIKKLIKDKKCGFIRGENNKDYFFHASTLKNARYEELGEGQEVTFEDAEGVKGPRAEDVFV